MGDGDVECLFETIERNMTFGDESVEGGRNE